ncbi:MAG: ABC transporter permease, partial [Lachnospiraceae bacterium]|nr:ABC transporter permease [Lachnospiraceae bacterium]
MIENIRLAFSGIWSHKMRSFLTMLGVIIGIASIIAIVSTIAGTNQQIMQNLIGAGNNSVTISLQQGGGSYWMDAGAPAGVTAVSDQQREDILALDSVADASFYT